MPFIVPQVSQQAGGSPQFQAPGVVPVQDQTGQQLQQQGQALERVGYSTVRLGDEIQDRNNVARVNEADSLLSDYLRQRLNPVDGYRSTQGKAAGDSYEAIQKEFETKRAEIEATLQNGQQRQAFGGVAQQRIGRARDLVDGHMAHQTSIYEAAQHEASAKTHAADYVDSLGDPRAMALSLSLLKRSVSEAMDIKGASAEQKALAIRESLTGTHAAAIDTLITEGDAQGAKEYLAQNGEDMLPVVRNRSSEAVRSAVNKSWAESEVMPINGDPATTMRVLRGIDGKLRRNEIGADRHGMALQLADQRIKAVTREQDLVKSEAISAIRSADPSVPYEDMDPQQRGIIEVAGMREAAKNFWDARKNGAPAPALEAKEAEAIVAQLGLADARTIKQVFTGKTTAERYQAIAGVVGVDWQKHETRVKGILDNAFGEKTPEAAISAASAEIKQQLSRFEWAHVKDSVPTLDGKIVPRMLRPLDERVVRGVENRILERLQDDPKLSIEEVMNDLSDMLTDSALFTMPSATVTDRKSDFPASIQSYLHPDDRVGSVLADSDVEVRLSDFPNEKVASSMPAAIFAEYARSEGTNPDGTSVYENLPPKVKQQKTIDYVTDWVSKSRPRDVNTFRRVEEIQAMSGGSPAFVIVDRDTLIDVKEAAAKFMVGGKIYMPTVTAIGKTFFGDGTTLSASTPEGHVYVAHKDPEGIMRYLRAMKQAQEGAGK